MRHFTERAAGFAAVALFWFLVAAVLFGVIVGLTH